MTSIFGGGSTGGFGGGSSFNQGPFTFGPSAFDSSMIAEALSSNLSAVANRYAQLGMGGSTPQTQDTGFQTLASNALTGQEQTADVTNPAINTALQTPVSTGNPTATQSLTQLISGLSGVAGGLSAGSSTG